MPDTRSLLSGLDRRMPLGDKLSLLYTLKKGEFASAIRPEYRALLARLGNPQNALPPVMHVAGTNGKGSTIATLRAILEAGGCRVHAYTSPHLIRFNERIVVAGQEISDTALEAVLDDVLAANGRLEQSFFEIVTATAFLAFTQTRAEVVLLETGLGGRLDSTNVVESPLACLITLLSFDHIAQLGKTIEAIAGEKAGIMKPGVPCIVAPQEHAGVWPVLRRRAQALGAPLYRPGDGWCLQPESGGDGFSVAAGGSQTGLLPPPALTGAHQIRNAGAAIASLLIQKNFCLPPEAFAAGLRTICWPGRLQKIQISLPPGWELWLDGGHNDSAAEALAKQIRLWKTEGGKPVYIITGMMARKDALAFAKPLAPLASVVWTIPVPGQEPDCHAPDKLATLWREQGATAQACRTWPQALEAALTTEKAGRILVTGSLYLAGLFT